MEVFKDARSIASYCIVAVLCLGPTIAGLIIYHINKQSALIRYVCGFGFGLLYAYIMFTTTTELVFCYIIVLCSNLMRLILRRHVPPNNLHTRELYCTILMSCFVKDMVDFLNSQGTLGSDANFSAVAHWRFC